MASYGNQLIDGFFGVTHWAEGDFSTMLSDGETGEDVPLKLMNFEL